MMLMIYHIYTAYTDDCVCILVQILHALFEAPQTADATFEAALCTGIIAAFTPDRRKQTHVMPWLREK